MFQPSKELETIFSTEAAFYRLETGGQEKLCRSLATIRRINMQIRNANALFVLLNPGKSMPMKEKEPIPVFTGGVDPQPLVPAVPDNTMYQLMRLMERMNWDYVKIINLTDLRTEKFEEYLESQRFMKQHGDSRHSVFSIDRRNELVDYAGNAESIIAGWGTKSAIIPAAEEAYSSLSELGNVKGLSYKSLPLFYHPFPWLQHKCVKWLDDMEEQLKSTMEAV